MTTMESSPSRKRWHTQEELAALPHDALVRLVLELEAAAKAAEKPEVESVSQGPSSNVADEPADRERRVSVQVPGEEEEGGWVMLPGVDGQKLASDDPAVAPPSTEEVPKKLERALSKVPANVAAASRLRAELAHECEDTESIASTVELSERLIFSTFFLPDLRNRPPGFQDYIFSKLTAPHQQKALEECRVLNWAIGRDFPEENKLLILWTLSDGNCLLHAALLAMWGLHDTLQVGTSGHSTLRAAMTRVFSDLVLAQKIRRRWTIQIAEDNAWEPKEASPSRRGKSGQEVSHRTVDISDEQLAREWTEMGELAGRPNAFLDSVHVLALTHALRRPIVCLAMGMQKDAFDMPLTPIFFRGIYLPLELPPERCCRQPLVLCFMDAHFMPLVPISAGEATVVRLPLADGDGDELPLRFALEEEKANKWAVVQQYMDIERDVRMVKAGVTSTVALLTQQRSHPLVNEMLTQFVERGLTTFESEHNDEKRARLLKEDEAIAQRQRQESEDRRMALELAEKLDASAEDASVTNRFALTLSRGARPGDRIFYAMPKDCTDPAKVDFIVPLNCYGGDRIFVTANFKIKGRCIQSFCEVAGVSREEAVALLTDTHGDVSAAVSRYFGSF